MGLRERRGKLEADYPFGGDGVAVDLGGGEIPAMRGSQGLACEIPARTGGEELGGGNVSSRIDAELDGNANGTADGGASSRGNFRHDLSEHLTLCDGAAD
jgi:hypothetical protein